jgi:trans-aconitate methyltransferase
VTRAEHWNAVFTTKREDEVSWFEREPAASLRLLDAAGLTTDTCVIDVGGGESHLVDTLIRRGLRCLMVLDVSGAALERTRARLGPLGGIPTWIEADVTGHWSVEPVDIWHDRAVFHFLTDSQDRTAYRWHLLETVKPGGAAIIATFALDGPEKCSGLPVMRYSPATLAQELAPDLELVESFPHIHRTPWGATQSFQYSLLRRA